MLSLGQIIDRYEVADLIGRGGMAVVYKLKHRSLGSTHALKVLELTSPAIRRRFELEGQVQARLNHPNVVGVTDTIEVDGAPGLVMEYVEGPPLDAYLALTRPDRETALALFRGICCGVAHAHAAGVVHRDLKPGNVMLALTDHGVVPKVVDFGLAKLVSGDGPAGGRATRTGAAMGTPAYMAPEQLEDAKRVDGRADVYALGVILYEMLCGRPPYTAEGLMEVIQQRLDGPYDRPEVLVPDLPTHLVELIDGMLQEDPDERLPDVRAVLERIDGKRFPTETIPPAPPVDGVVWEDVKQIDRRLPSDEDLRLFTQASVVPDTLDAALDAFPESEPAPARSRAWLAALVVLVAAAVISVAGVGGAGLWWAMASQTVEEPEEGGDGLADAPDEGDPEPGDAVEPPAPAPAAPEPAPSRTPDAPPEPVPASTPAPEPSPRVEVVPVPVAEPAEPEPAPTAMPREARPTVTAVGDADRVYLRRDGRDYQLSDLLEPGEYEVRAIFDGAAPVRAGRVALGRAEAVTLKCDKLFQTCAVR